jgi:Uma2 family endonuclease
MGTVVHIPVSEYLRTSYRPDCNYVDGEVEERNLGEEWHSAVQTAISAIFYMNRKEWRFRALTEQRVKVSSTRFRIPDVCVVPSNKPFTAILTEPSALCVEVLSPEDRFQRIVTRAQEFTGLACRTSGLSIRRHVRRGQWTPWVVSFP